MKQIAIVIGMVFCCMLYGCQDWLREHVGVHIMHFCNNTDYEISVYSAICYHDSLAIIYPDTSLPSQMPYVCSVRPKGCLEILSSSASLAELYEWYHTDTISYFIFSKELIFSSDWDSIRTSYSILQRYDVALHDYSSMPERDPCFPPTPEMRNIKMWPPYGTYDSLGHPVQ